MGGHGRAGDAGHATLREESGCGTQERWLAKIGWPGDRASLRDILVRLANLSGEIALNVDILPDRVGEKLGLEIYGAERTLSMDTWQPLHDELLAKGLARADKLAALRGFPWFQRYRQFGIWLRTPPLGFPVLITNLHHLKLVFVGDTVVEAKAYLGVFPPRDRLFVNPGRQYRGRLDVTAAPVHGTILKRRSRAARGARRLRSPAGRDNRG